ncbi:ATP-grasp peptide maturase system methyltransferase [Amycolatopsis sp. cg5]|uniref:ATP-grasp peptide maturase system methyltransferase n=1 Tax=Amycolatopsis sp. cg5 TaxID=3238802 RepID=UPI0035257B0D
MTTTLDTQWQDRAAGLADTLTELGKLTDPDWQAAVRAVARHELVPRFYTQDTSGAWIESDTSTQHSRMAWLDAVYSNKPLITALQRDTDPVRVLSSSSQPGLMTRMLESLDVHSGHQVLEIGTGTGYNAALLSHRLGAGNVFSVDVEPDLIDLARTRLAALGYTPTLVAADGALGLPEHGPFDRIIATCAVPAVPWAWVQQLRIGGVVLTDLKVAHGAGNLVRITRTDTDRAEGRFDPTYAAFMSLRHQPGGLDRTVTWAARDTTVAHRWTSTVDPQTPWNSLVVWFLAAFDLGPDVSIGYTGSDTTSQPSAVTLSTPDGSWAQIALATADGAHQVTEGGPRRLWLAVERAHQLWNRLDQPGWDRFGLTVTPEAHTLWFDHPDGDHRWT